MPNGGREYIEPFQISKYTQPITCLQCVSNYHIVYILDLLVKGANELYYDTYCPYHGRPARELFTSSKNKLGNETLERSDLTSEYFVVPKKLRDEPLLLLGLYDLT
jgi:hypothetical protein